METKKISYNTLKDVLKPKQMKNILGGSGDIDCSDCSGDAYNCSCNGVYKGTAKSANCCICYCF